jgi:glycosyltransferase involved in cell wall biosynthesis
MYHIPCRNTKIAYEYTENATNRKGSLEFPPGTLYIFVRMDTQNTPDLSIVIIARNEEAVLGRSLDALKKEISDCKAEIILVDSASTDSTFSIARSHSVKIIKLADSPYRSPAGARYIGTLHARGRFIFYMDGDMVVAPGWLKEGMRQLEEPSIGGAEGILFNVRPGEDIPQAVGEILPAGDVDILHGSVMYRREVLEKSFTFNPYLKGEEERELGYRVRQKGYRLVCLHVPMVYHFMKEPTPVLVDRKASYHAGQGQIYRKYLSTSFGKKILREAIPLYVEIAFWYTLLLLLIISTAYLLLTGKALLALFPPLIALLGFAVLAVWKGANDTVLYIRARLLIPFYIVQGYMLGMPDPPGYEKLREYVVYDEKGKVVDGGRSGDGKS